MQNKTMDHQWFKHQLQKIGKTQRGLALAIGRDASVVSKILRGEVPLSLQSLEPFADFLEISPSEALTHLGYPGLLKNKETFDRTRLVYAAGGILEWAQTATETLDCDELAEHIADFYQELGKIDESQWRPAISHGMGHRVRAARILKDKQARSN